MKHSSAPAPLALPFLVLGGLCLASVWLVVDRWGQVRTFDGSLGDLLASAVVVLALIGAVCACSASPLRVPIGAVLALDTLRDTWMFANGTVSVIGPVNLAVECFYVAALTVLYFDRAAPIPAAGCAPAASPDTLRP